MKKIVELKIEDTKAVVGGAVAIVRRRPVQELELALTKRPMVGCGGNVAAKQ